MSSSCTVKSTLEQLPDEILLLICRNLSSVDIFFSFYGLNSRLSKTISGYYQHVVLAQVPFKRFNFICKSIQPHIGTSISSLVVSNEWTGVLSKMFLTRFGGNMSLAFPRLKHLTLIAFISKSLTLFIDCLQNLTDLSEINISGLFAPSDNSNELQTLLHQILVANNNRLNSIIFDSHSAPFTVDMKNNDSVFSNIEKLHINLKTINDLHRLLTILPRLRSLYTQIYDTSTELDEEIQYITISSLKYFHLESFHHGWNLNDLASVLKRIPNVEDLSIEIDSFYDTNLVDGHQMFSLLSALPLKKFNYFLRLYTLPSTDHSEILSTWQQFDQEFACINDEDENITTLYTLPFLFDDLIIRCSLAKHKVFSENYVAQVKFLHVYRVSTHLNEIFCAISKCHRLRRLCLQVDKNIVSTESKFLFNTLCQIKLISIVYRISSTKSYLEIALSY
jgi:hypothetical protein